jgi:prepilin-type N-terminal cleavage/methylation domain-containing protein
MKMRLAREANRAMTLLEVLVVIAVVLVLIATLLPALSGSHRPTGPMCMNNVKQIEIGFIMCIQDNYGKIPIQTSVTNDGTMEYLERNQTFPHYQKIALYIRNPSLLVCPDDKERHAAENFEHLTDTNISYFLNADVTTKSASIMSGDRHLQANGNPVRHGTFTVTSNLDLSWTSQMHSGRGVLGFADGRAQLFRATDLNLLFQRQGLATSRLSIP